jgi:hypothetical protein
MKSFGGLEACNLVMATIATFRKIFQGGKHITFYVSLDEGVIDSSIVRGK